MAINEIKDIHSSTKIIKIRAFFEEAQIHYTLSQNRSTIVQYLDSYPTRRTRQFPGQLGSGSSGRMMMPCSSSPRVRFMTAKEKESSKAKTKENIKTQGAS